MIKKISLILSIAFIAIIYSCDKYEEVKKTEDSLIPDKTQRAFMGELTSTTCGICGSSGYDNFNLMKKNNSGKIVALAFHCNFPQDSMQCPLLYSYESSRPSGGSIPSFHIGDTKTPTVGMQPYIDTLLKRTPEAQVKFNAIIVGDSMKITSKIKFFKIVSGDYYVSFYLCESGIDGGATSKPGYKQSSGVSDYKHNNVVRSGNVINNAYGKIITSGTSTAINTVVNYNCGIYINPRWKKDNIFVTAVIWKKNSDNGATCQYLFVNGWDKQVYN